MLWDGVRTKEQTERGRDRAQDDRAKMQSQGKCLDENKISKCIRVQSLRNWLQKGLREVEFPKPEPKEDQSDGSQE